MLSAATFVLALGLGATAEAASSLRRMEAMRYPVRPYCPLTSKTDIQGNDMANVQAWWSDCCHHCSITPGCRAWSWTDFNGGTCWLKSERGPVVENPNAISASIYEDLAPHPTIINVDFEGGDLKSVPGSRPFDCDDACRYTPDCRVYSWTDFNGGTCWLKSDVTQAVPKPGVTSGSPFPYGPVCVLERGMDFVGYDIGNAPGSNEGACCKLCKERTGCRTFTWTDFNGGTCWLKSGKGEAVANPGAVSGTVA
ncbi:hypothetical protein PINS_up000891 [Pythium insidiosum]|nr:hypothetical protein PINS_up000891 [Pythium insidiosum]